MSRSGKFVVYVSVIWCVGCVALLTRRTSLLQLLSLPLVLLFFAAVVTSLACVFTGWRQQRWRSMIPLLACVIAFFLSGKLVRTARHFVFVWALPSYEAVIRQMESGSIPVSANLNRIPRAEPGARWVYRVFAARNANGVLMVEFLTETGFPVKHSGYLYSSSGVIEPGSEVDSRWPIRHEVRSKWFFISD